MRRILIVVGLCGLLLGCRRECDCAKECGGVMADGPETVPVVLIGDTAVRAAVVAGATAGVGTTAAGSTASPAPGATVADGATAKPATAAGATVGPAHGDSAKSVKPAVAKPSGPEKEYCASESGEVFHRCSCTSVKRIKAGKLVKFKTRAEALGSGRRPCKPCKP